MKTLKTIEFVFTAKVKVSVKDFPSAVLSGQMDERYGEIRKDEKDFDQHIEFEKRFLYEFLKDNAAVVALLQQYAGCEVTERFEREYTRGGRDDEDILIDVIERLREKDKVYIRDAIRRELYPEYTQEIFESIVLGTVKLDVKTIDIGDK